MSRERRYFIAGTAFEAPELAAGLYVVATPIGNLRDMTIRGLETLAAADVIFCEDTRTSAKLSEHFGFATPRKALHEHNEAQVTPRLIERLRSGEALALISDAGTPLVSDPGARLVAAVIDADLRVIPVPGASATLAALVGSGFIPHPCTIIGFLARKGTERRDQVALVTRLPHAVVLFESANRLVETLRELAEAATGPRRVAVARELTKHYEEFRRGTLLEVAAYYEGTPPRGEIVIVLDGATTVIPSEDGLREVAQALRAEGFRPREIVQRLMDEHGASRNLAYRLAHDT